MDRPHRADSRTGPRPAAAPDRRRAVRLGVPVALLTAPLAAVLVGALFLAACAAESAPAEPPATTAAAEPPPQPPTVSLHDLVRDLWEEDRMDSALRGLDGAWQPSTAAALVDFLRVSYEQQPPGFREACFAVIELLEAKSGESYGGSISAWYRWLWRQETSEIPEAARIKATLFERIDPRFARYFGSSEANGEWKPWPRKVRLDEVRWGGVEQDGIPPLRSPKTLGASEAHYMSDSDIVYGVTVGSEARAYPRRVLGWHELVTDRLGGQDIAGVYCTLCGTMLVYDTGDEQGQRLLGTSGFLYRSNKLMYDKGTQSLWSTLLGVPVIGPLVGTGAHLPRRSVVATTWGEWKRRHPTTTVLDVDTGFDRDYAEGAAYADYYATDELMFDVPARDARLPNKAEVIGLAPGYGVGSGSGDGTGGGTGAFAVAVDYLRERPTHIEEVSGRRFVFLTDATGAVRVYGPLESSAVESGPFTPWEGGATLNDALGGQWRVSEDGLKSSAGEHVPRAESTRAFWFAWFAAHPETELRSE